MGVFGFYRSTIGKKFVVAITGVMLFGFVISHMAGNLKAFMGIDPGTGVHKLDLYAQFLREMGSDFLGYSVLLWIMRIGLLVAVVLHVVTVIQLTMRNRASRPVAYGEYESGASTLASRTMAWGGMFLFFFIIVHLLHLTFGTIHYQGFIEGSVYANVVKTFQVWYVVLFYLVAMVMLGLHLFHGVWSVCQTLGLDNPDRNQVLRKGALVAALVVSLGFMTVPLAAFVGILTDVAANSGDLF